MLVIIIDSGEPANRALIYKYVYMWVCVLNSFGLKFKTTWIKGCGIESSHLAPWGSQFLPIVFPSLKSSQNYENLGFFCSSISPFSGYSYVVRLTACAQHVGRYHTPLAFVFTERSRPNQLIHIVRYLSFRCNNALIEELMPKAPYKRPPRVTIANSQKMETVDGLPVPQ